MERRVIYKPRCNLDRRVNEGRAEAAPRDATKTKNYRYGSGPALFGRGRVRVGFRSALPFAGVVEHASYVRKEPYPCLRR